MSGSARIRAKRIRKNREDEASEGPAELPPLVPPGLPAVQPEDFINLPEEGDEPASSRSSSREPAPPPQLRRGGNAASPTHPIASDTAGRSQSTEYELLQARRAQLQAQVATKRMQEEIIQLQQELAGEMPEQFMEIAGTALPSRKRAITDSAEQSPFSRIRRADLPRFGGKSPRELTEYLNKWQVELEDKGGLIKGENHRAAITVAAKGLEGLPLSRWLTWDRRLGIDDWDEYIEFCKGCIIDPANRKANAIMEKMTMKQKPGQKVQAVLRRVVELEADIPEMDVEQEKGWHFLNILLEDTRDFILRHHKDEITSREQVVQLAQRFEELEKPYQKGGSSGSAKSSHSSRSTPRSRNSSAGGADPQSTTTGAIKATIAPPSRPSLGFRQSQPRLSSTPDDTHTICHKCNKKGHRAKNCPLKEQPKK